MLPENPLRSEGAILYLTDGYKPTHWLQYPPGTETVESYFESRGGAYDFTVAIGLEYLLHEYLAGDQLYTPKSIDEADDFYRDYFGGRGLFNKPGWLALYEKTGGRLPVEIWSQPVGMVAPTSNVITRVRNTIPEAYWLTNYLETLLVENWHCMTVAALSRSVKQKIL